MTLSRFPAALAVLVVVASASFAADEITPSRTSAGVAYGQISSTTADSITIKFTVTVPTGKTTGSGKNRRPQFKTEEKEETIPVIKGVVVKDTKAKEGKGDFSTLAAPEQVKLKLAKETVHPVGSKAESRLVVTQIDIIHPPTPKK